MTDLTYSLSRQDAATMLWVSTRTIDRYIKKWQLSYKKIANKILLAVEELSAMQKEYELLYQNPVTQTVVTKKRVEPQNKISNKSVRVTSDLGVASIKEFSEILNKKDKTIEEKNQMIFILQRQIGEVETKVNQMVALPDYSALQEKLKVEIKELEMDKRDLEEQVRKEKLFNTIALWLWCVVIVLIVFFTLG